MTAPTELSSHPPHGAVGDIVVARTERILTTIAYVAKRLLHASELESAIPEVLGELGCATGVSRVYVFETAETDTDLVARQRWEWVAAGIEPQIDNPDLLAFGLHAHGFEALAERLRAGQVFAGDVASFREPIATFLAGQDIRSLVVVPIEVAGSLWGFVGFDECLHERTWSDAEVAALATAADVLAGAIQQDAARRLLRASEHAYAAAYEREREATTRLRTLDGMKDAFLEAVSHELRTPLTAVLGFAETLRRVDLAVDPEHAHELTDRLIANANRLRAILDDLLDLEHLTRGVLHPAPVVVDVPQSVTALLTELDRTLRGRVVEVDLRVTTARVDPAKLERILANLLRNAARHTPPTAAVTIRAWRADGHLQLAVEDAGPGIPDEHKSRVFEPFNQGPLVSRHSPGTGVGLSVVARYAVVHGGGAWIEDRPGGGTVVRVRLAEDLRGAGDA